MGKLARVAAGTLAGVTERPANVGGVGRFGRTTLARSFASLAFLSGESNNAPTLLGQGVGNLLAICTPLLGLQVATDRLVQEVVGLVCVAGLGVLIQH